MSRAGDTAGGALSGAATGAAVGSLVPGVGTAIGAGAGAIIGGIGGWFSGGDNDQAADEERKRKELLYQQAAASGGFADQAQQGYGAYGAQGNDALAGLRALAQGQNSVSAEQLRQGLQQNLNVQRSLAAGASPQNAAMAARTAAIQSGRIGAGLAGQQAVAGLQERNQAWGQYGNLLTGLRGQDLNATLGARQNAMTGYGASNAGTPPKSWIEQWGPAISGPLSAYAMTKSDRRAKEDIRDGDRDASRAIEGLRTYVFKYKNQRDGKGRQLGVMTDELKRSGLGHAVVETPDGDMVHGAKLATSNTGMIAALGRRVAELEGGRKGKGGARR